MKNQHQAFIISMIKHGDKVQAYRAAYPKCTNDETARKSAERLLRHHPEISAEIDEAAAYMRQRNYAEAYREFAEQQKTPLLSMMKRREILAQIATCQMKVGRFVKDGDRYKMLFEDPRPRDIMRAIETDVKMEDACNRLRNCNDPFFSQFYIYIDGRPCDQPHLPPDPNLPPGIFMLPRRRKNQIERTGIKMEQNQITSPPPGDLGVNPAQEQNQNPGIKMEHLSRQGGENLLSPSGGGSCAAAGGGTLAQEKSLIEEPGPNSMPQPENQNPGIKTEQNQITSPPPGVPIAIGIGVLREPEQNPQPCPPTKEARPDPLAASFYKQEQQARAAAPPPRILTPEEVKALDEEYAQQHKDKPVKPSTFGKMYFKEKGIDNNHME